MRSKVWPIIKMRVFYIILVLSCFKYGDSTVSKLSDVRFSNELLSIMYEGKGNLAISPFSLQYLMLFLYIGANDDTAKEISKVGGLPTKIQDVSAQFNYFGNELRMYSKYLLNIRNRIYKDLVNPKTSYAQYAKAFHADLVAIDNFTQLPSEISKWIQTETSSKIQSVNERIDIHIVSSIYIVGQWNNIRFTKVSDLFYANGKESPTSIYYFQTVSTLKYYHDYESDSEFVELTLMKADFALVFYIPKFTNETHNIDYGIANKILSIRTQYLKEEKGVYFQFPADVVKTSSNVYFKQVLGYLGMRAAFSDTANFEKLSDIPLRIEDIIQDTYININAVGVTAASASISENRKIRSVPQSKITVTADRPFIYYLINEALGVLFAGRYVNPNL